jgi:hypothetical protein
MFQFRNLAGEAVDEFSLCDFELETILVPEIGDGEDGVRAGEGGTKRSFIVEIGGDDFGAELSEGLGGWLLGIAGYGADTVAGGVLEDEARRWAALETGQRGFRGLDLG